MVHAVAMATELVALTARTIRTRPVIRKILPITGNATSKSHDKGSLPCTCRNTMINQSALRVVTAVTDR